MNRTVDTLRDATVFGPHKLTAGAAADFGFFTLREFLGRPDSAPAVAYKTMLLQAYRRIFEVKTTGEVDQARANGRLKELLKNHGFENENFPCGL